MKLGNKDYFFKAVYLFQAPLQFRHFRDRETGKAQHG